MTIKSIFGWLIKKFIPSLYWKKTIEYYNNPNSDLEVRLLPILCDKEKMSVDIGASGGLYIVHMTRYSSQVNAFEPIPAMAENVQSLVNVLKTKTEVKIHNVALSDHNGVAELRILANDFGRSTIEQANVLEDTNSGKLMTIKVPVHQLDEYDFKNVGCIKIDVEGHELSVLKGASKTIEKNMPTFIIEAEDRHRENAVTTTTDFLKGFGYDCFFICEGKLHSFNEFDAKTHQDPKNVGDITNHFQMKGIYINNFVFVPAARSTAFLKAAGSITLS